MLNKQLTAKLSASTVWKPLSKASFAEMGLPPESTLGIDAMPFLWRSLYSDPDKVVRDVPTKTPVLSLERSIREVEETLSRLGLKALWVLDGATPSAKIEERDERDARAEAEVKLGDEEFSSGHFAAAHQHYQRGVRIAGTYHHTVLVLFRRLGIEFLVAPFEADAQLVYLQAQGLVQGVWTPDFDLVILGSPRMIVEIKFEERRMRVFERTSMPQEIRSLSHVQLITLALIGGCDYVRPIHPMTYSDAIAWTRLHVPPTADAAGAAEEVSREFLGGEVSEDGIPEEYVMLLLHGAFLTFTSPVVFSPEEQKQTYMRAPDPSLFRNNADTPAICLECSRRLSSGAACSACFLSGTVSSKYGRLDDSDSRHRHLGGIGDTCFHEEIDWRRLGNLFTYGATKCAMSGHTHAFQWSRAERVLNNQKQSDSVSHEEIDRLFPSAPSTVSILHELLDDLTATCSDRSTPTTW